MKHKLLIVTLTAIGLSLSSASHALLIWMPDGTRIEAKVVGNKLMLQDTTGNLISAGDGIYKTEKGQPLIVQGGIITSPNAQTPTTPTPNTPGAKFVKCPLAQARTEIVSKLPKDWWQTPYEGPLLATRVEMIGGENTLICEYQAYTTRAPVMTKMPSSMNCVAVTEGFNCR